MIQAVLVAVLVNSGVFAATPTLEWARQWSRTSGGGASLLGTYSDPAGTNWALIRGTDIRLLKFDPAGVLVQESVLFGYPSMVMWPGVQAITVDASGNCYLAGMALQTSPPSMRNYFAKYGPGGGAPIWTRSLGGEANYTLSAWSVATDGVSVWVGGDAYVNDEGMLMSDTQTGGVIKLSAATGAPIWSRSLGDVNDNPEIHLKSVVTDGGGNVFVISENGYYDAIEVAKLNAGGAVVYDKLVRIGSFTDTSTGLATYYDHPVAVWRAADSSLCFAGDASGQTVVFRMDGASGTFTAAGAYGGAGWPSPHGIAIDGSGNVHVAVESSSPDQWYIVTFDPSLASSSDFPVTGDLMSGHVGLGTDASGNAYLTSEEALDTPWCINFVTKFRKYSSGGALQWTRLPDTPSQEYFSGVGADAAGNAIVGGMDTLRPRLIKYDTAGTLKWWTYPESPTHCLFMSNGFAQQGNVSYMAVEGSRISSTDYLPNLVVLKYDSSGARIGEFVYDGLRVDLPGPVTADAAGNVVAAATVSSPAYDYDFVLVKFDSSGNITWSRSASFDKTDFAMAVALDAAGNSYVIDVTQTSLGAVRLLLVKFGSAGSVVWTRTYGGGILSFFGPALRVSGSYLYMCADEVSPGDTMEHGVVRKIDLNGNTVWSRTYTAGGGKASAFLGVGVDASGNVFATGSVGVPDAGAQYGIDGDILTVSYDPAGNLRWSPPAVYDSGVEGEMGIGADMGSLYVSAWSENALTLLKYSGEVTGPPPAASLVTALAVTPRFSSPGTTVEVVLSVTNTGNANATGVTASVQANAGAGAVEWRAGPAPAGPVTLAANGGAQKFTWTYSLTASADIEFTATVSGIDAGSGSPISAIGAAPLTSTPVIQLVSTLAESTATGYVGSMMSVLMRVTNTGTANATPVSVALSVGPGASLVSYATGPLPAASLPIMAGGAMPFIWLYFVSGSGTVVFTVTATATDAVLGTVRTVSVWSVNLLRPASLSSSLVVSPSPARVGQWVTVSLTVSNSGQLAAANVSATLAVGEGTPVVGWVAGPVPPGPVTIAAGGSQTFSWTYSVSGAGTIAFAVTATGTDTGTGAQRETAKVGEVTAADFAQLAASLAVVTPAGSSTAFVGQWFEVHCTVSNTGGAAANGVGISLGVGGGASLVKMAGPSPAPPVVIAAGASQTFVWTYSASGGGAVNFVATVAGMDPVFGALSAGASATMRVQVPARLVAWFSPAPWTASVGQWQPVVVRVQNSGDVAATGVSPLLSGAPGVEWVAGPSPAGPVTLGAGAASSFTWTFSASGVGVSVYSFTATGVDSGTGASVTGTAAAAVPVQTPASLTASLGGSPGRLKQGQVITVTVYVANPGQAAANGVTPVVTPVPAAAVVALSGPTPAPPVVVPGSGGAAFTWTYQASAPGLVVFTAGVAGADANSGLPLSASSATWTVTITAGAILQSSVVVSPASVRAGGSAEVRLVVSNSGQAAADSVTPTLLLSDLSLAQVASGPVPSVQTVGGSASATFVWQVTALVPGTVTCRAAATGTDAGDLSAVSTQAEGTLTVTPSALTGAPVIPYPNPVSGDRITVALQLDEDAEWVEVDAYSVTFEMVFRGTWRAVRRADGSLTINGVSSWAPGPYLLKVRARLQSGRMQRLPTARVMVRR